MTKQGKYSKRITKQSGQLPNRFRHRCKAAGPLASLQHHFFDLPEDEIQALLAPEAPLVRRELAHHIVGRVAVVAADPQSKAVEALLAAERSDDALDAVVAVCGAAELDADALDAVRERVREDNHLGRYVDAVAISLDYARSGDVHEGFWVRFSTH